MNAYVKFDSAESCEKALALNNSIFNGHHLRVDFAEVTCSEDQF